MAKEPTPTTSTGLTKADQRANAEQEMFMREVDEAVRQDEVTGFAKKWGWPLGIAIGLFFAAFAGYLFWQGQTESALEADSEAYIQAMDELEAGNVEVADQELALLAEGEGGVATMAAMLRAGIALEAGRKDDAISMYDAIAADGDVPAEIRDAARLRSVTAQFDDLDPQEVIERIGGMAVPDNAYFGSAGELVAHAYLAQEKESEAGALFAEIAKNEDVPPSIRDRARQMAAVLGVDTIDNVNATLAEITGEDLDESSAELVD